MFCLKNRVFFFTFFALFLILFIISSVCAEEQEAARMVVEANIFAPIIKISVSEHIFLGNLTKGYSGDRFRVEVNNTGTVDVVLTPKLSSGSNKIFENLFLARRTTEEFLPIGRFNISIAKPSDIGKVKSDYFYIKMDLSNYKDEIRNDKLGEKAEIVFWAVPA